MIKLQQVTHQFNNASSLAFDDWTIRAQEQWLLLGASGSGKTTLLHIIAGLLKPERGTVSINETPIYALSAKNLDQFRGRNIGVIFQRPHLIKSLTVLENLILAQRLAGFNKDHKRIKQVLDSLNIAEKEGVYPSDLSQGQQQRVSIARAVINRPIILIADEPTSSLDDQHTHIVMDLLKAQSESNKAVLLVATHDKRMKDSFTHRHELT